jgi:hypothetical protein
MIGVAEFQDTQGFNTPALGWCVVKTLATLSLIAPSLVMLIPANYARFTGTQYW